MHHFFTKSNFQNRNYIERQGKFIVYYQLGKAITSLKPMETALKSYYLGI